MNIYEINSGSDIKELINIKNLNVRRVSLMAGIKPSTLYSVIQQDRKSSLGILLKLAEVLPVRIDNIKTRGLTGKSDVSSHDLPLAEDTVRTLRRMQIEKQCMIEDMLCLLDEMDDTGWAVALDIIRVLRKIYKRKRIQFHPRMLIRQLNPKNV